jgi:adenine C2-methylase RlmN of 23S rRNA A2503 and tRNA A37
VIEYTEEQFQKDFLLYALVAQTFRAKQLTLWLYGDLKSFDDMAAEIFLNATTGKG